MQYNFDWDQEKAKNNIKKHSINFELAATVFNDPRAITIFDIDHSEHEERWLTIGISETGVLLVTSHTYKQIDDKNALLRIISSRKATQKEIKQYNEVNP